MQIHKLENGDYNTVNLFNNSPDYQPRKKRILACNRKLEFYPNELRAYSYGHWNFLCMFNGILFLNMYKYSNTTYTHQMYICNILNSKGINYVVVNTRDSLSIDTIKYNCLEYFYKKTIKGLFRLRLNIRKNTRNNIIKLISFNKNKIKELKTYGLEYNIDDLKSLYKCIKHDYITDKLNNSYSNFYKYLGKYRVTYDIKKRNRLNSSINKVKIKIRKYNDTGVKLNQYIINNYINDYRRYYKDFRNTELGQAIHG